MKAKTVSLVALEEYVNKFRELAPYERWLRDFPRGVCADASEVLGMLLAEHGFGEWEILGGAELRNDGEHPQTHAWIRQGSVIIDVTFDQFTQEDDCFDPNAGLMPSSEVSLVKRFSEDRIEPRVIGPESIGSHLPWIIESVRPKLAHLAVNQ